MITIYHNPKCSKSRAGLCEIETLNLPFTIRRYLDHPLTKEELVALLEKLQMKPIELVRTKEAIWKEQYREKEMNDAEIIDALLTHPKLIERPIVVFGDKAIIARPIENINDLLG